MKRIYTPTKPKKILIVDDDQAVASIYHDKFESEGFDVEIADSGEDALQMLAREPADLVILDFSLPGTNGVAVLEAIRSGAEALPVIVFTNAYLPTLAQAASKAGATRCVRKSECTPNQMMAILREVFAASAIRAKVSASAESASASATALPVDNSVAIRSAESGALETDYQTKLVAAFLAHSPERLRSLRTGHHAIVNSAETNLRLVQLFEMHRQARFLTGAAAIVGFRKIAQLASALEALLFQLHGKPASITPSAIRTVSQSVDLLDSLCDLATGPEPEISISPAILVVDDEVISRETICSAIERTGFATVSLDDPIKAENLLKQTRFDLIFLDIEMPGQSGLDLCASIRTMATNRATPVVFVTGHSDFGSWAQSSLRGGNDFIAKPFLSGELAVKALTWLFTGRPKPVLTMKAVRVEKNADQPQALGTGAG
jgi:CheY-like chemotaxis protein/HPt (histidine-containing phosphotransfer) domain-containing protein